MIKIYSITIILCLAAIIMSYTFFPGRFQIIVPATSFACTLIVLVFINKNLKKLRTGIEKQAVQNSEQKAQIEEFEKMTLKLLEQMALARIVLLRIENKADDIEQSQTETFEANRINAIRNRYNKCMEGLDWSKVALVFENMTQYLHIFAEIYKKIPYLNNFLKKITEKTEEAANTLIEKFALISSENQKSTIEVKQNLERYQENKNIGNSDFQKMIADTRSAMDSYKSVVKDMITFNQENLQKFSSIDAKIIQIHGTLENLTEIANQSKVIYLNLSIEAVQLGEKGKGIQIIVKEIQKLNNKTTEFIRDINQIIQSFQDFTQKLQKDLNLESQNVVRNMESSCQNSQGVMNSLIQSYEVTSQMFIKLSHTNNQVQNSLDKIAESLQFQDITRQQIENMVDYLSGISMNIEEQKSLFDFWGVNINTDNPDMQNKIISDFGRKAKVYDEKKILDSGYTIKEGGVYDFHAH